MKIGIREKQLLGGINEEIEIEGGIVERELRVEVGDIIVKDKRSCRVMATSGELVAVNFDYKSGDSIFWYVWEDLKICGWAIEGSEDQKANEAIKYLESIGKIKDGKVLEG